MHSPILASWFAALFDFNIQPHMIAIVVPIAGLVFAGTMAITAMYFQNRRRQMWHETARLALEKGQPLPADWEPDAPPVKKYESRGGPGNDLRAGLILLGTGLGLYFFLGTFIDRGLGYVGAIPGFIGVALVLFGLLRMLFQKKAADDIRAPRA